MSVIGAFKTTGNSKKYEPKFDVSDLQVGKSELYKVMTGIPSLYSEPARSAQLTKKSQLFWLANGSLKKYVLYFFHVKQFAIV